VSGRLVSFLLDSGDGTHISGIGTADGDVRSCAFSTIFGPFVGPSLDDSGSWGPASPCTPYPACRPPGF
jgi:hypothetical protein